MTNRPQPIVVVSGLPRSGTSLLMAMLGAGGVPLLIDEARAADASNPQGYFERAEVKRTAADDSWVPFARGRAVKVISQLLPHLPATNAYRVLLLERDLSEVIASQDAMLLASVGHTSGVLPAELRPVFQRQLEHTRGLLERQPEFEWMPVSHRRLILDPVTTVDRVANFVEPGLEAPLDREAMASIVDPSLYRQRSGS